MLLSVINPFEVGMGFGEFPRPDHANLCCRHQPRFLLKSKRQASPWQEYLERRNQRHSRARSPTLSEQPPVSAPKNRDVIFGDALDSVLSSFTGSLDLHRPSLNASNPVQWRTDSAEGQVYGEVQLPEGITNPDDLKMELDEKTRILTLSCAISGGLLGRFWQVSQRLDDSMDVSQLEAFLNKRQRKLELKAPLRQLERPQDISVGNRCDVSEERRSPVCGENGWPSSTEAISSSTEPYQKRTNDRKKIMDDLEIEDLGPDEESDRISVSAN